MASYAIFYDATNVMYGATGDRPINRIVQAPDDTYVTENLDAGETYIEISVEINDLRNYKISWVSSTWALNARTPLSSVVTWDKTTIASTGKDVAALSGVPNPTTVFIEFPQRSRISFSGSTSVTVTTGSFSLDVDEPGLYTILVFDPFPYAPYAQVITAV